jgi:hypothetical protein
LGVPQHCIGGLDEVSTLAAVLENHVSLD